MSTDPMVPLRRRAVWGAGLLLIAWGLVGQAQVGPGGWVDVTAQMGALLVALGLVWEILDRTPPRLAYRNGLLMAAGTTMLLIVANGAVGIAGAGRTDLDRIYLMIAGAAIATSALGHLRPKAMRFGMGWCASMVVLAGFLAFREGISDAVEAAAIHIAFASLYAAARELFDRVEKSGVGRARQPEVTA